MWHADVNDHYFFAGDILYFGFGLSKSTILMAFLKDYKSTCFPFYLWDPMMYGGEIAT